MRRVAFPRTLAAASVALAAAFLSAPSAAQTGGPARLIAWNDLGMHCMDPDFSIFSILPPYNNINAQLIVGGKLVVNASTFIITYEAVADPSGSINKTSIGKTNFWQWALPLFGLSLAPDVGLTGAAMPGAANQPQPSAYEAIWKWFHADGIPLTPFDDAGNYKPYGLMRLVARNQAGQLVASTVTSTPVSQEMLCSQCHASGSSPLARPSGGWAYDPDPVKDDRLNVLKLHDEKHLGTAAFTSALATLGLNPAGLLASATLDQRPILCAACHGSNALPGTGLAGIEPLTEAMHARHALVPNEHGLLLDNVQDRSACYTCHPGNQTQCLRGAMGKAIGSDGQFAMQCQSCHGSQSDVGAHGRVGWLDQPNCQQCHTGTATQNSGAIRFTSVFDAAGNPHVPANLTFATEPDVPAAGFSLYRFSAGHGDLQCSACHGSPHAIWPTSEANDNLQATLLQGHVGTLTDCSTCHSNLEDNQLLQGPHGMHPPTNAWAADKHGNFAKGAGLAQCQACHGANSRGTVLSLAQGPRSFNTEFGNKAFFEGQRIGCYDCHSGPSNDNPTTNHKPSVPTLQKSTPNDTPLAIPLTGSDADGQALTYRIVSQPAHGTAGIVGSVLTYYPNEAYPNQHYTGPDSLTYAANDGFVDSNLGSIQIAVLPPACAGSTETYGFPAPGSGGFFPRLEFSGCPSPGQAVALQLSQGLGGSWGFLVMGQARSQLELLPGLTLRVTPIELLSAAIPLSPGGPGQGGFSLPGQISPTMAPFVRTFQVFLLDPGSANGVSASNGLEVRLQ
jgi:Bacterial Ig domain